MIHDTNIIEQDSPDELNSLKNRLYISKRNRLEMIDGFIDRIRGELETRELKDIPTPQLTRMLVHFADLARKEQPIIELQYKRDAFDSERVTF